MSQKIEYWRIKNNEYHKEWRKYIFVRKVESIYDVKNVHDTKNINDYYVNNIAEWNILHDILNPSKCTKITN